MTSGKFYCVVLCIVFSIIHLVVSAPAENQVAEPSFQEVGKRWTFDRGNGGDSGMFEQARNCYSAKFLQNLISTTKPAHQNCEFTFRLQ